ncbi:hypothetical protein IE987_14985 [Klebsiella pneumoniae]|uniref:Uncharacterized protein n=1 Tax=Klebsiella pneumoniae TaxID=573 RepID=A0A927HJS7_KLEPN|nr:hypothetical protein [Klebsiella pneumoniae]MBD3708227.1 hypothetical protein [Klebsiella pneumoniae]
MAVIVAGWYRQHMPSGYRRGVPHGLRSHGPYSGWSVYVSAKACGELPDKPSVLSMTNLLREAITRAAAWQGVELNASQKRLAGVILDEIGSLPEG